VCSVLSLCAGGALAGGGAQVVDSEESVLYWLRFMQERRFLPR
jgi:hypothetical protein